MPAGTSGFHRLNISEPSTRAQLVPAAERLQAEERHSTEPMIRMIVCRASV